MANFPLLKAGGWLLGELLTPAQANALNAMLPKIPNFQEGSSHTPSAMVQLLGTAGLKVATLRGQTAMSHDGTNEPRLTITNLAGTKEVEIDGGAGSVTVTDAFLFAVSAASDVPVPLVDPFLDSAGYWTGSWGISTPYGRFYTQQSSSPSTPLIAFTVPPLPTGCTVTKVAMFINGSGGAGSHGSLPANKPSLELAKVDGTTRAKTAVATVTDAPANVAAYETLHWVETTAFSHAYDRAAEYALVATGESGANSVMDALTIHAMRVTYSSAHANR